MPKSRLTRQPDKVLEVEEKERVEEAGNIPVLETVNNTTENPDTALDLNPRPIHFQRRALSGLAESLDTSADPSRDEDVEVMEVKPHPWPLARVSARYAATTGAPPPSVAGNISEIFGCV